MWGDVARFHRLAPRDKQPRVVGEVDGGAEVRARPTCTTPPEWSNPVWVPSRGWCGSQGGRPAHVLKTPTSGREDGSVRCVQSAA